VESDKQIVPAAPVPIKLTKLTKAQLALLDTLADPRVISLDVTQICKLANITRATYYNAFKDSDFLVALEQSMQELLIRNESHVLHNVINKAKDPAEKNQHWAHMVLKMRGRLEEKQNKPAQITVNFNVKRPDIVVDAKVIDADFNSV
jgi:hypothetical protein